MTTQTFLIGPMKEGLRKDQKPWSTPEDSFVDMTNAYQFRGRIVKRSGYKKLGRLANGTPVMGLKTQEQFGLEIQNLIAFDTTQAYLWSGTVFNPLPSVMPVLWSGSDSQFFYTTNYAGAFWATNSKPGLNGYAITNTGFTGATAIAPFTVQVDAAGNNFSGPVGPFVGDTVYFLNVTAGAVSANNLRQGIVTVAGNPFTVQETDGLGAFVDGVVATGMVLSTTRTAPNEDGIRFYGVLTDGTGWANYNPPIDPNNALAGAQLIFPYRGYLVFLNTTEGNEQGTFNFGNRARWTELGTPYYQEPVPQTPNKFDFDFKAARDDLFGRGGANDAPTSEIIVGAGFIRDILVVFFERSTWRLRFVNNAQNPFVWERINVELGSSCTGSSIIFDKGIMAISNRGIAISDGNDTNRFDEKIPDDIFNIRQENDGLKRVQGIRTFRTKLNYWTYPSSDNPNGTYPDKVLVFNYENQTWSFFDDVFTTFGYYYVSDPGLTWGDLPEAWSSYTNVSWNSGVSQQGYESIVAGNQQGYVLELEQTNGQNDPSLSITNINNLGPGIAAIFTSPNNNIPDESWITLSGVLVTTSDDGVSLNGRNFKVANPTLASNDFVLTEFKPIFGGIAIGATYDYTILYKNLIPGSIQINIGAIVITDPLSNGNLVASAGARGTINYDTGQIHLDFNPPIIGTAVNIRIVSLDPLQGLSIVSTIGVYGGGGEITRISPLDITTKIFNFFQDNKRARLERIDFYNDSTADGQFTVDILADSSNEVINTPLSDNPQSNIVLTSPNPYQIGQGEESIYRLYTNCQAQTVQLNLYLSDAQLAVNNIARSNFELLNMMFYMRKAGRLP